MWSNWEWLKQQLFLATQSVAFRIFGMFFYTLGIRKEAVYLTSRLDATELYLVGNMPHNMSSTRVRSRRLSLLRCPNSNSMLRATMTTRLLRLLPLFLLTTGFLLKLSLTPGMAQCPTCTITATNGGTYNLTSGQTLCITGTITNITVDGTGTVCIGTGATWNQTNNLTFNSSLSINVYGTFNANTGFTANGGAKPVISVKAGGVFTTNATNFGSTLSINNQGTTNFTAATVSTSGSFSLINAVSGVVNATATGSTFTVGNTAYFQNAGVMNFANQLENSEGDIRNLPGATIIIGRRFYNHGNLLNEGTIKTLCNGSGTATCDLTVGDKGPGKVFSILATGCVSINGNVSFGGPGFVNGTLELSGDLTIDKAVSGTNGRIIVTNGTSTIGSAGTYNGTNMRFCDRNTASGAGGRANGFDVVNANNPATTVVYTVDCSPNPCTACDIDITATPGTCAPATNLYTISGTISLTNAVAGVAIITDGANTTTLSVPANATSVAYSLAGLLSNGASHTVTVSLPGCGTATATYVAPVSCSPKLAVTSATTSTCADNRYTVSGTVSLTSASAGTLTLTDGTSSTTVSVTAGQTSVAYSLSGLTSGTGSHTVIVSGTGYSPASATYTAPATCCSAVVTVANQTICNGNSTTLTANASGSTGFTYRWSTGAITPTIVALPTSTTVYSVTVTGSTGCSAVTTATVTVNAAVTATISVNPSSTICNGTSATLTASGGTGYAWSTGATTAAISVSPATTTTYSVTVSNANSCSAVATTTITVNPAVTATVADQTICNGNSATLTANTSGGSGFTYAWRPAGTGSTQSVVVSPSTTTSYTVTVTNSNGCSAVATATVTVNPAVTAVIAANPSLTICNGTTTILSASGGTVFRWNTGATTASIPVSPTTTTTYSVTVTNAFGCSAIASTTVTVNPSVTANLSNATICNGTVASLSATGGTNYLLSNGTTNTTGILSVTPIATTVYSVTVTNGNGCSAIASGTVTVNPAVTATVANQTICNGTSTTLTANVSGGSGFSYNWSPVGTGNTQKVVVAPSVTTVYTVTVANSTGCSAITSATVTVNAAVTATVISSSSCNSVSTTLTASSSQTGLTYQWSGPGGFTASSTSVVVNNAGGYTLLATNGQTGCTSTTITTVSALTILTTTVNSATLTCQVPSATLTASSSQTGLTYQWRGPASFAATTQRVTVTVAGSYTVVATNPQTGCSSTAIAIVTQDPGIAVTLTQSSCRNNSTDATTADDYYTITISAVNTGNVGTYEVVVGANADGTGGTVLNPGGTAYGTSVTAGDVGQVNAKGFRANGTTLYPILIRTTGTPACNAYRLTGEVLPCSSCLTVPCIPPAFRKQ